MHQYSFTSVHPALDARMVDHRTAYLVVSLTPHWCHRFTWTDPHTARGSTLTLASASRRLLALYTVRITVDSLLEQNLPLGLPSTSRRKVAGSWLSRRLTPRNSLERGTNRRHPPELGPSVLLSSDPAQQRSPQLAHPEGPILDAGQSFESQGVMQTNGTLGCRDRNSLQASWG